MDDVRIRNLRLILNGSKYYKEYKGGQSKISLIMIGSEIEYCPMLQNIVTGKQILAFESDRLILSWCMYTAFTVIMCPHFLNS